MKFGHCWRCVSLGHGYHNIILYVHNVYTFLSVLRTVCCGTWRFTLKPFNLCPSLYLVSSCIMYLMPPGLIDCAVQVNYELHHTCTIHTQLVAVILTGKLGGHLYGHFPPSECISMNARHNVVLTQSLCCTKICFCLRSLSMHIRPNHVRKPSTSHISHKLSVVIGSQAMACSSRRIERGVQVLNTVP